MIKWIFFPKAQVHYKSLLIRFRQRTSETDFPLQVSFMEAKIDLFLPHTLLGGLYSGS